MLGVPQNKKRKRKKKHNTKVEVGVLYVVLFVLGRSLLEVMRGALCTC